MSDETVHAALRSDVRLVVVEAPAGSGKTHQGALFAGDAAALTGTDRVLILTHTHAACTVFAQRTKTAGPRVVIRTVDSLIMNIAAAYHAGLGLPADAASWARQNKDGYAYVALKVAKLLRRHPMIATTLASRYPLVICDEHQDCSGEQHAVAMAFLDQGARVRVFGDPMQRIYKDKVPSECAPACNWDELKLKANVIDQLDTPHRWNDGCAELGRWTLRARDALKNGGQIDLRDNIPRSVEIVFAENQATRNLEYRLSNDSRRILDVFEKAQSSLLVLTRYNETSRSLRSFFNRRIPLWEGHTRTALETLGVALCANDGDAATLAATVVKFMDQIGKGFSPSAFGDRFEREASEGCSAKCNGKPAMIQQLARHLVVDPNHRGVAKMLRDLLEFSRSDGSFSDIKIDCHKEFWDAIQLGAFDDINEGLAEITHRRTYSRPKPPERAISTIHKAKGLECGSVIVMPCDAKAFPNKMDARCLLYVALSRAKNRLLLVVSRDEPSPLFSI